MVTTDDGGTARKPRIEYVGPVYHVMSREGRSEAMFRDDAESERFLAALSEVCARTGWWAHGRAGG